MEGNRIREELVDERGTVLRTSWHPDEHLIVLSLWREGTCIGTFRATPEDAGRLGRYFTEVELRRAQSVTSVEEPTRMVDRAAADATRMVPRVEPLSEGDGLADTA